MNLTKINEVLRDLNKLRNSGKTVEVEVVKKIDGEEQGEEGLSYEVYKLPEDNLYVKLKITTDSYGEDERISGLEFVQPKEVTITQFKAI